MWRNERIRIDISFNWWENFIPIRKMNDQLSELIAVAHFLKQKRGHELR